MIGTWQTSVEKNKKKKGYEVYDEPASSFNANPMIPQIQKVPAN